MKLQRAERETREPYLAPLFPTICRVRSSSPRSFRRNWKIRIDIDGNCENYSGDSFARATIAPYFLAESVFEALCEAPSVYRGSFIRTRGEISPLC